MMDSPSPLSSILVDVELPDPEPLPSELIRVLSSLRVVLLGWFSVPEQTSPAQARDQFREEARATLDEVARRFEEAGTEVTTRLVFTGDKFDTLSRISTEEACDAVLIPGPIEHLRRLLVPLRGLYNVQRIVPFIADLIQDSPTTDVTLLHVLADDDTDADADLFDPVVAQLAAHDVDTELVERRTIAADAPAGTIVDEAANYDLVVLGETKPSVREVLFGTVPERIVRAVDVPVVVVRHEDEAIEAAEKTMGADSS